MSHAKHENLSALMDGQLSQDQIRFMLRQMDGNASLCTTWDRYHVMGDSLRHEMHGLADADLAERIMRQIDAASGTPHRRASHRWLRWSAGGAIAAGVAVAALVVIQPQMRGSQMATTASASSRQAIAASRTTASTTTASTATVDTEPMGAPSVPRWLSVSPAAAQLAQPAAATFSPNGRPIRSPEPQGYSSPGLAPYMTIPHARGLSVRDTSQVHHRWWQSAQSHRQAAQQAWRLQAQ